MTRLQDLYNIGGQSPWLDNLRRDWIHDGQLAKWIQTGVRGITSNPTILAKAISGQRGQILLVSKVYPHNATRQGVVAACERSLKRLNTDHLDLYRQLLELAPARPQRRLRAVEG